MKPLHWIAMAVILLAAPSGARGQADPWEDSNRSVFGFNVGLDDAILEPTAQGWSTITGPTFRHHLSQFFTNLRFPVRFVSTMVQGQVINSSEELARFALNSTVGIAGIFDPATLIGLGFHNEDFGLAMAAWGIPAGPYVVLPFFGSSNPRDTLGLLVDTSLQSGPGIASAWVGASLLGLRIVNQRTEALGAMAEARLASLDFYAFARNAHAQQRGMKNATDAFKESEDDLYKIEDE